LASYKKNDEEINKIGLFIKKKEFIQNQIDLMINKYDENEIFLLHF
jgi:hypothetical protein